MLIITNHIEFEHVSGMCLFRVYERVYLYDFLLDFHHLHTAEEKQKEVEMKIFNCFYVISLFKV